MKDFVGLIWYDRTGECVMCSCQIRILYDQEYNFKQVFLLWGLNIRPATNLRLTRACINQFYWKIVNGEPNLTLSQIKICNIPLPIKMFSQKEKLLISISQCNINTILFSSCRKIRDFCVAILTLSSRILSIPKLFVLLPYRKFIFTPI